MTKINPVQLALLIMASLAAVEAQQGNQLSSVEIGRGVCGNQQLYTYIVTCAIVSATPSMTLQVGVLRQISNVRCINGINFGLGPGNAYIWTSNGCSAEFSIFSLQPSTAATNRPPAVTAMPITATTTQATSVNNFASCGVTGNGLGFRIIGGAVAGNCQFPWMVMVYNQFTQSICGGTIIDSSHILTAAHCFIPDHRGSGTTRKARPNELLVYSGSSTMISGVTGLKRRTVIEIITHESFNNETLENDIAILKLREAITFDGCHRPLCLVDGSKTPQEATNCRTMGWGLTSNVGEAQVQSQLQYVDLPVAADVSCRGVYGSLSSEKTFCAGTNGKDACQGDSGGPFTCREADGRYYIYGIVSAGIDKNCGQLLGLYTRVSTFLPWITNNVT